MKKFIVFVLAISSLILVSGGHYDSKDISHTVSVITIGIDKGDNMPYRFSFQIEKGKSESDGEKEEKKDAKSDIISIEAPTFLSALARANSINSIDLSIENIKMVIISENIAKNGVKAPLKELVSANELKSNPYVVIAKKRADEVMKAVKPEEEEYISVYYEEIVFRHYQSAMRNFLLHETYFDMVKKGGADSLLPLVAKREEENFENSYRDDTDSKLTAGMTPKESKHEVEFLGGAVLKDGVLKGYLTESEMLMASVIGGFFKSKDISIEYPSGSFSYVTFNLSGQRRTKKKAKKDGEINFEVTLNLDYETIPYGDYSTFDEEFMRFFKGELTELSAKVMEKTLKSYDADIFSLKNSLKKKFLTTKAYEEAKFRNDELKYTFTFKIESKRAGRFTF